MKFLKLIANSHELKVETNQTPNQVVFMNRNKVFLIFQNHCQLWDLMNNIRINKSQQDDNIYFWTNPIPINETTIAFVNLNLCEPQLATFDIKLNSYTTLYKFNKESINYDQIFYNKVKDQIMIVTKGKINMLYWYNDKQVTTHSFPEFNSVSQFDRQSTLALSGIEYSETKKCCFTLNDSVDSKQYEINNINGIEEICCVNKYSENKAIVGIIHKQKDTSTVVIFNMLQSTNLNVFTINFPLDKLILSKFGWLAMRTTQERDSTLQIQSCFESTQQEKDQEINFAQKIDIPQQFRIWGDQYPIATIDILRKNGSPQSIKLSTVRFVQKRDLYIKMIEDLGFDKIFYNEIVGSVLKNIS